MPQIETARTRASTSFGPGVGTGTSRISIRLGLEDDEGLHGRGHGGTSWLAGRRSEGRRRDAGAAARRRRRAAAGLSCPGWRR